MRFFKGVIYNRKTAKLLGCSVKELHMRSVYIPSCNVIYFCNPKVAGSSIIQTLLGLDRSISAGVKADHNLPASRREISSLRDPEAFWRDLTNQSAFRFAFVRNPYARLLSCFRDKIESGRDPRFRAYIGITDSREIKFIDFLRRIETQPVHKMNRHWMPQSELIPENIKLSLLGRFENLDADLTILADRLGLSLDKIRKIDPHKTNTGIDFHIEEEEARIVNRVYAEDFRRFSYKQVVA